MKKIILFCVLLSQFTYSQVSAIPNFPTTDDSISITFDATGTELDGYSGDIYAHTEVTING